MFLLAVLSDCRREYFELYDIDFDVFMDGFSFDRRYAWLVVMLALNRAGAGISKGIRAIA